MLASTAYTTAMTCDALCQMSYTLRLLDSRALIHKHTPNNLLPDLLITCNGVKFQAISQLVSHLTIEYQILDWT